MAIDGTTVRAQDVNAVFSYLGRFDRGHALGWEFVQKEWSNPRLIRK